MVRTMQIEKKGAETKIRACALCGKSFVRFRQKKYCSVKCRADAGNGRAKIFGKNVYDRYRAGTMPTEREMRRLCYIAPHEKNAPSHIAKKPRVLTGIYADIIDHLDDVHTLCPALEKKRLDGMPWPSELDRRCRELRAWGVLRSIRNGRYVSFLKEKYNERI